jgi:hypothetical protein
VAQLFVALPSLVVHAFLVGSLGFSIYLLRRLRLSRPVPLSNESEASKQVFAPRRREARHIMLVGPYMMN